MKHMSIPFTIILGLIFSFCSDSFDHDENKCYSFDERQCGVDPFAASGDFTAKENVLKEFLNSEGIEVGSISFQEDFYDAVCEACTVCPEIYRIFIKVEAKDSTTIHNLNLFNLKIEICDDVF